MINRRGILAGLISLVAAPAIVRASNLMPVKSYVGMDLGTVDTGVLTIIQYRREWRVTAVLHEFSKLGYGRTIVARDDGEGHANELILKGGLFVVPVREEIKLGDFITWDDHGRAIKV